MTGRSTAAGILAWVVVVVVVVVQEEEEEKEEEEEQEEKQVQGEASPAAIAATPDHQVLPPMRRPTGRRIRSRRHRGVRFVPARQRNARTAFSY